MQISALYWVASPNWPPVTRIIAAIGAGTGSGELPQVFGSSLYRMLIGYSIGTAAALVPCPG